MSYATIQNGVDPNEAQAITGDSGGAVFRLTIDGNYELSGLMPAVGSSTSDPSDPDNVTFIADLAAYRDKILAA